MFRKLDSPRKIQDFIGEIPINFERGKKTLRSPGQVLRRNKAHCVEGALLAAAALWYHGEGPMILDLRTTYYDYDHTLAVFKEGDCWGAISKTNHAVLRYRDPVYKNIRELAMSYFNEYFWDDGAKTMRSYSLPFNLLRYGSEWLVSEKDLWHIPLELDAAPHFEIAAASVIRRLRPADKIEIKAGKLTQWP